MPSPQFQFRYVILTYSQCGSLDPFRIVDLLSTLGAECIIGREHHQDGGIHLHAFVDFGRKFRTRNQRSFDVDSCHPNIAPVKTTPRKAYDYCIKDGEVVAGGLEPPKGDPEGNEVWSQIASADDPDEFWSLCQGLVPRNLLLNYPSLRAYANHKFRREPPQYIHPPELAFRGSDVARLSQWSRENVGVG